MNPNRTAISDSALRWLNIVQRGGTEEWKTLYQSCHVYEIARQVAATLPWRDSDLLPSAHLWKFLLQDLHPDLEIDLHETDLSVGF